MKKLLLTAALVITSLVLLGFVPLWPHGTIFGAERINSFEYFGGCWQGDVRLCDLDPLR